MTERHVKMFVFGKLLPIRGVDNVWERRYGWHWIVEIPRPCEMIGGWHACAWLNKRAYKEGGYVEAD